MHRIAAVMLLFGLWISLSGQVEGYYSQAEGKTGDDLKQILHDIIDDHTELSYSDLWNALVDTDEDPADPDRFILVYTGRSLLKTQVYPDWNREHTWAKSHGGFDDVPPAGTDLHHIKPSDVSVNGDRGNKDFDYCAETGTQHSEATDCYYTQYAWEPRDQVKGDIARMMFYMAVRYEGDVAGEPDLELQEDIPSSGPYFGKLSTLLEWNEADPPDAFEIRRNNRIYETYQGNRNPFIDHPEYVDLIWKNTEVGDTVSPVIDSITVIDESTITVWYSEDVVPSTSLDPVNYIIDRDVQLSNITQRGVDFSAVVLTLDQSLSGEYQLSVSNVTDYEGNIITPVTVNFVVDLVNVSVQYDEPITIYPNPSTGILRITGFAEGQFISGCVQDITGRFIRSFTLNGSQELDISELPGGIYLLRILSGGDRSFAGLINLQK